MKAQWNIRLPSSRAAPFSAATAGRPGSAATRKARRRSTRTDDATAASGGTGTSTSV